MIQKSSPNPIDAFCLEDRQSLRYSKDDQDYNFDRLSYSTDGTDIDFNFEEQPYDNITNFSEESSISKSQKKSVKRKIFQKYHKLIGKKQEDTSNDIMTEFDRIFQIPTKDQQSKKKQKQDKDNIIGKFFKKKKHDVHANQLTYNQSQKKQNQSSLDNLSEIERMSENSQNLSQRNHQKQIKNQYFGKKNEPITCETLASQHSENQLNDLSSICSVQQNNEHQHQQYKRQQDHKSNKYIKPIYEQEDRIPIFLRQVRFINSIYPNFHNPKTNIDQQIQKLGTLCDALIKAHSQLQKITIQTLNFIRQPKYLNRQMTKLSCFLTSGWEKSQPVKNIELIKPRTNIPLTKIKPDMIIQALNNYQQVLKYYQRNIQNPQSNHTIQQKIDWYIKIRNKFWAIQKNIRSISEDVYKLSLERQHPNYVYWYLNVLRSQMPSHKQKRIIEEHNRILNIVRQNRQRGDILSISQVGQAVKNKLQRQLKYLNSY